MDTMTPPVTEPGPPGASAGFRWSGIPWWLIALIATIGTIAFMVVTDEKWRQGFDFIRNGLSMTLIITAAAFVIALVLGLFIGLARISKNVFLSNVAMYYIEFIRGVPVIVTIFMFSLVVWGQWLNDLGVPVASQPIRATLALGLIYAAFIAEVFRAGIESISTGQREAGESVGLSKRDVLRFIVLPQAVRNIMPALGNDLIALLKDSSLVSVLAVRELTQMTKIYTGSTFRFMEGYLILTGFYLVLTLSLSLLLRWYERRIQVPGH
jgi:polar amino acid transport system permease protein